MRGKPNKPTPRTQRTEAETVSALCWFPLLSQTGWPCSGRDSHAALQNLNSFLHLSALNQALSCFYNLTPRCLHNQDHGTVSPKITGLPQSLTHRPPPLTRTLSTCSIYSLDTEGKKCYHLTNYCNYHSNYQVVSTHPLQLALFYFASITSYTASFRGRVLWRISAPTPEALLPSALRRGDGDTVRLQLHLKKTI